MPFAGPCLGSIAGAVGAGIGACISAAAATLIETIRKRKGNMAMDRGSYGTEHPAHALLKSVEVERLRRSQGLRPRRKVGFVFWTPTIVSF